MSIQAAEGDPGKYAYLRDPRWTTNHPVTLVEAVPGSDRIRMLLPGVGVIDMSPLSARSIAKALRHVSDGYSRAAAVGTDAVLVQVEIPA